MEVTARLATPHFSVSSHSFIFGHDSGTSIPQHSVATGQYQLTLVYQSDQIKIKLISS